MAPSLTGIVAPEGGSVEVPALELLEELGWERTDLMQEVPGPANPTGRTSLRQTYLPAHLRTALAKLNPTLPAGALKQAEEKLARDRTGMLPVNANREVHGFLVDGVPVQVRREADGKFEDLLVRVIDWKDPAANHFLAATQVWIEGVLHKRRPDTIGFVNGLPLLLAEWKAPTCPIADAYDDNLRDYRDTIPRLFDASGFVLLSNGLEAVMGASHAPYEFYAPWKRLEEGGPEDPSLETILRATCEPRCFLDLIENFLLFDEVPGGMRKIVGKYHQVLGVNRAIEGVSHISQNQGKLGVFWHTQGSGKSLSMVMFAEKVLRRLGGNYTFVVVTDRTELDDQIAGQFASVGALTKTIDQARPLLASISPEAITRLHYRFVMTNSPWEVLQDGWLHDLQGDYAKDPICFVQDRSAPARSRTCVLEWSQIRRPLPVLRHDDRSSGAQGLDQLRLGRAL